MSLEICTDKHLLGAIESAFGLGPYLIGKGGLLIGRNFRNVLQMRCRPLAIKY